MTSSEPQALAARLVNLLTVTEIDTDRFRGARNPGGVGRLFGGQAIAQALQAASQTVSPQRTPHSLHAYFLRAGSEDHDVTYRVERDFDGGSFSNRRVIAEQLGNPILNLTASFQKAEAGLEHQADFADAPPPEGLPSESEVRLAAIDHVPDALRDHFLRPRAFEFRPLTARNWMTGEPLPPHQASWVRVVAPIGDDPALHRAALAYASDMQLLGTCVLPHGLNWMKGEIMTASLDHAIWFHADFRVDDWLLYECDSPWSGRGRGLNHGTIRTRDGRLVASVAQEGLIRRITPKA